MLYFIYDKKNLKSYLYTLLYVNNRRRKIITYEGMTMIGDIALYVGSIVLILWGIAHIVPTRSIVTGFEPTSEDNKRIITMEWIAEGLTLSFIGVLVLLITIVVGAQHPASILVYRLSAMMLVVMAGLTLLTGARTSIVPIKICPIVKTTVALLFFLGSVL